MSRQVRVKFRQKSPTDLGVEEHFMDVKDVTVDEGWVELQLEGSNILFPRDIVDRVVVFNKGSEA